MQSKRGELDYKSMTDEQLVDMFKRGDEIAAAEIYTRYKNTVRLKSRPYFILGADRDDIVQEGMIGLFKAMRDYSPDKQTVFHTFAELCITRQIITAIQNATRQKHAPLNSYISLSRPLQNDDPDRQLIDVLPAHGKSNPEELVISMETFESMISFIKSDLTPLEYDTLALFMEGRSCQQIADKLGCGTKSVDNALQRIKRKVQKQMNEQGE